MDGADSIGLSSALLAWLLVPGGVLLLAVWWRPERNVFLVRVFDLFVVQAFLGGLLSQMGYVGRKGVPYALVGTITLVVSLGYVAKTKKGWETKSYFFGAVLLFALLWLAVAGNSIGLGIGHR